MGKVTFKFSQPGQHFTWASANQAAQNAGGRLPTLKEFRKFVKNNGGYALYPGKDLWCAVQNNKKGGKDWCQAGDKHHKPGKSHVKQQGGYPSWGDDSVNCGKYGFNVVLAVAYPRVRFVETGAHYTWSSAQQAISNLGGRMCTLKEARKYLKGCAIKNGGDFWAPVIGKGGGKDWVQVGNKHHYAGKSHTQEQGGYPSWGDDSNQCNNYGFNTVLLYYKADYKFAKTNNHFVWDTAALACLARGGRLLTIKEAKEYLKNNPILPGQDAWAAVLGKNGKDWVQIGNKHHYPGKSHVQEQGGYPSWGDDKVNCGKYGFNTVLLWQ